MVKRPTQSSTQCTVCNEKCGDEAGIPLDGDRCIKVLQILVLDLAFASFDPCAKVVQCNVFTVYFYTTSEDEAVDFIYFVPNQGERDVGPAVGGSRLLLPLGTAKLENIVVHIQWQGNVEII